MSLKRRLEAIEEWLGDVPVESMLSDEAIRAMGKIMNVPGDVFLKAFLMVYPTRVVREDEVNGFIDVMLLVRDMLRVDVFEPLETTDSKDGHSLT